MQQSSDTATPRHAPTFGAMAEASRDQPIERHYAYRIASTHDCSGNGSYTKNGAQPRTTAYAAWFRSSPEADWEPFDLHLQSPGFALYAYTISACAWLFFALNALEREIDFRTLTLECQVDTTADYFIRRVTSSVAMGLAPGAPMPSADDDAYMIERASVCPVARNIGGSFEKTMTTSYHTAD